MSKAIALLDPPAKRQLCVAQTVMTMSLLLCGVKRNQHGERATTIAVATERLLSRGKWRTVEVLACPLTFSPHPQQIEAARRAYEL